MHFDIAFAGLVVGFVIGLTGMGGGALMTPVLVLLFHVNPSAAISSDVVASMVLKPIGGGVHVKHGTVNWRLVRWLSYSSVPCAFAGAYVISNVGGDNAEQRIKTILGLVLLVAAAAMALKVWVAARRHAPSNDALMDHKLVRPFPTLVIGAAGGFIVGLTSVGSGSLIIVSLMLLYPLLSSREMVGTDLVQAVPLVAAAALGHLLFGEMKLDVTGSVLFGAIPGVYLGAQVSTRASDRYIRPVLVSVLTISSLKLLDVSNQVLLGAALAMLCAFAALVVLYRRQDQRSSSPTAPPAPTHPTPSTPERAANSMPR
jgi:uncharacterized membrane protein YfcA